MLVLKGKHSTVYVTDGKAVKVFKPNFRYNFWKEVRYLTVLQSQRFVPRLYYFDPSELKIEMEFIEGQYIKDFIKEASVEEIRAVLERCLDICYRLDRMRIQKEEMNHPDKHIIVRNNDVVFIDFERSFDSSNPSNVTQFVTYLTSRRIREKAGISKPPVELLKEYKKFYDFKSYTKLKKAIFG
jgi:putative serine/threonine protein kinase